MVSRDAKLDVGHRRSLAVFEVRATVGYERLAQPPTPHLTRALVNVQAHRRRLAVVTVRRVAVGIAVGDAHDLVAVGVDLADELARPVESLKPPAGQREACCGWRSRASATWR